MTSAVTSSRPLMTLSPVTEGAESDARAVTAVLEGDIAAFDAIVHAHHARVFRFLRQMTGRHHDSEDLTQRTFIAAYRHLAKYDRARPMLAWLLTIARNTALNHLRDTRAWEALPEEPAASAPSPARTAEQKDDADRLWSRARTALAPREFEVLWLRFGEDLSTRETADVVQLTETHVKVLLHRARQTLLKGEPAR